ncbi:MAG TPA: putative inorganic carbon transporter subunit DabA, partial [Gemmataceae bacterium]|nr:putative inorganic carbon transporter subunit DabA [Gemmataceae bacterium]
MSTSAVGTTPVAHDTQSSMNGQTDSHLAPLKEVIDHAAHLLPAQGPITVFIHHNTLHAFEDLPFTEAVKKAAKVFGCQPYLPEDRYREELQRGRIRFSELQGVLREELGTRADQLILRLCTRLELRLAMLHYPLRYGPTEELLWFMAETDALRRVRGDASAAVRARLLAETRRWVMRDLRGGNEAGRDEPPTPAERGTPASLARLLKRFGARSVESWGEDVWEAFTLRALWRVCRDGIASLPEPTLPPQTPARHRDLLLAATGTDPDLLVHDVLVRFCGAFLDQGLSPWRLPRRDEGFYRAFCALYRQPLGSPEPWLRGLAGELARLEDGRIAPLESIRESLALLGVAPTEWELYLSNTLLALRGWAGILHFLEERPDRAVNPVPPGSLTEFLAVRLVLDRLALVHTARTALGFTGPLETLRGELRRHVGLPRGPSSEQRAFLVFQLAQVLGWSPRQLHRLDPIAWIQLLAEIEGFAAVERRRVFHQAYERRFYRQTLDALALHNRRSLPEPERPRFQALFCIDEREESLRRHLEEVAPDAVTYGIAGFYFLDMYYRGATDAHFVPLCPAVLRPGHWVVERVVESQEETHQRRARTRRVLGKASHQFHLGSRSLGVGALLSAAVGVLATVPLVARTLFPRLTARIRRLFGRIVQAPPQTRLQLERGDVEAGPENGQIGFTLDEMTNIAERVLRDTGLTSGFARL